MRIIYVTHLEVVQDAAVPVPDWPLSAVGRARMRAIAGLPGLGGVRSVWSSTEEKARNGAEILAEALGLDWRERADLGENDRSATGYLPPERFEAVVDQFFGAPDVSVLGWERAVDAQARVVSAVRAVDAVSPAGDVAIVAHGGVGNLLMCHLRGVPISRSHAAPCMGGYFSFQRQSWDEIEAWQSPPDPA